MLNRIARLAAAEGIKAVSHPFFYVSVAILLALIPLWTHLDLQLRGKTETEWHGHGAIELFARGAGPGFQVATLLVLIFSSMLFAGEVDRGTVKLLLTRPVRRGEVYAAKGAVALLFAAFLLGVVLYISGVVALARGELGPAWDEEVYLVTSSYDALIDHAGKALALCLLPLVASVFLGILISTLTDSPGYAVAAALVMTLLLNLVLELLRPDVQKYFFNFSPGYAFETLRRYSEGSSVRWNEAVESTRWLWLSPLLSASLFTTLGWLRFRSRDIQS